MKVALRDSTGDTKTDGQPLVVRTSMWNLQRLHLFPESLGHPQSICRARARQQDNELLPTISRHQIGPPASAVGQCGRDLPKALIASEMAVQIVELLEEVDIQQDDSSR